MIAKFDEILAMTLQDIKETKHYGRMDTRSDNEKTVYPPQTKFAGGIKITGFMSLWEQMTPGCDKFGSHGYGWKG